MKIGHLRLRALTRSRTFGVDIPLTDGLNVIRADNTSGKSTCLMAVVYCLGLERSLGPSLNVPLPYAMRHQIQVQREGGAYEKVLQSYVMVEISNSSGEVLCVRRDVEGGTDKKLVQTWRGCRIDNVDRHGEQRDFFLHDPGAAVRDLGFHSFLAAFLDLQLPTVPRFDGSECPLYLETLWPLFFVEQKRGWSATQGPFPTYFAIQDLSRRVMEFVLRLDVGVARRRHAELRKEISYVEQRWRDRRADLVQQHRNVVRVSGLPAKPTVEFIQDPEVGVSVYFENEWMSVEDLLIEVKGRRQALEAVERKDTEEAQSELQLQLKELEERESELSARNTVLRQEHQVSVVEKASVDRRLKTLEVDLSRNLDAQKLQRLGSTALSIVADTMCPTCHQPMERELLPEEGGAVMAIGENIAFVRSQLDMYRSIMQVNEGVLSDLQTRYESVRVELSDVRSSIRALKNDLMRPAKALVWSEVEQVIRLESRISQFVEIQEEIDGSVDELQSLARQWVEIKAELNSIRTGEMSALDRGKVSTFQSYVQEFLGSFGFLSFGPGEFELADDDFRPRAVRREEDGERVERNIGFEASASDGIRLKWAYYLALLEVSQRFPMNHIGMIIFDEPGQQQMREVDLASFLGRVAESVRRKGQVVVSTSEDIERVRDSLKGSTVTIHNYEGFMIQPMA